MDLASIVKDVNLSFDKVSVVVNSLDKRISNLEDFKSQFVVKKEFLHFKKLDYDFSPADLSKHFGKSYENFRTLKKKYEDTKDLKSMWIVYCKAYYLDKLLKG